LRTTRGLLFAALLGPFLTTARPAEATVVPDDYATIQAAINAVRSGALPNGTAIDIRTGTYNEALSIRDTAKSMTLHAMNGTGTVTVNAAGKNQSALTVWNATGTIRIEGLRFTGGLGNSAGGTGGGLTLANSSPTIEDCAFDGNTSLKHGGAGLIWFSNPTFVRCSFTNNSTVEFGGGFVITGGARPTFVASTFQGNTAGTGSSIGSGGAIHANDSSPTLRACTVTGNHAKFAGGAIIVIGAAGSANGTATLQVEDSDINGNTVTRASPSSNPAEGGGIHVEVNALGRIIRSRIRNNVANTGGGLNAALARYEVQSSIIEGNQAPDPANVGGFGGGIQALSNGAASAGLPASSVVLTDSVVRNNTARIGGGLFINGDMTCGGCTDATAPKATLNMTDSLVDNNTATDQGGGIYSNRGALTISGGLISRNKSNTGNGLGGGVAMFASTATFSSARIAANQASQLGGGVFADLNSTLSVSGSSIYRNTAGNTGGALHVGSSGTNGGTVQTSALVDNVGTTIAENCPASAPRLTYTSNTIVSNATTTIYNGICNPPGNLTVSGLNALPSGRASGNTGTLSLATVRSLAYFAVTPDFFPAVLAWSVIRATSVSITPPVSPAPAGDTGTVDVDGIATVGYSFSATTPLGSVGPIAGTAAPSPGAVNVTFTSQPSGLTISVNGTNVVTPATVAAVQGLPITAVAPLAQTSGPNLYLFSSWDGVLQNALTIATPAAPVTYTAWYQQSIEVGPLNYYSLAPCRVVDTRYPAGPLGGPALAAGSSRTFAVWNACGIPTTARALSLNVTATQATTSGDFRIHSANQLVVPGTSVVNFVPGVNRANNAVVALDGSGRFSVVAVMASGSVHLVIDVTGYFE
jgi:predicted outer membrane repeat protein